MEVIRGPLTGFQGKLVRKADGCRLVGFIHVIGQGASIEMEGENTKFVCSSFEDSAKTTGRNLRRCGSISHA